MDRKPARERIAEAIKLFGTGTGLGLTPTEAAPFVHLLTVVEQLAEIQLEQLDALEKKYYKLAARSIALEARAAEIETLGSSISRRLEPLHAVAVELSAQAHNGNAERLEHRVLMLEGFAGYLRDWLAKGGAAEHHARQAAAMFNLRAELSRLVTEITESRG